MSETELHVVKIIVLQRDGTKERLTLLGPLKIIPGEIMARIVSATGMEHWFTADGYYDGWGRACCGLEVSNPADALKIAEAISSERETVE